MKENRNWVVTGASGGIGAVLVEKLLEKGFRVAALSRTPEKIEARHGAQEGLRAIRVDVSVTTRTASVKSGMRASPQPTSEPERLLTISLEPLQQARQSARRSKHGRPSRSGVSFSRRK